METDAKFRLMGAFALAAIFAAFAFVYWLNHGAGLGEQSVYQIKFVGAVAGLQKGAPVQFNGVRVGEVTDLKLDPDNPQEVLATVSVDRTTPVRADTKVRLDTQGLMGVTSIALLGGASNLPALQSRNGAVPVLSADRSFGADLSSAARDTLERLNTILADNSAPLRDTISNLNTFTAALAKNSDRIDGIIAGLERLTGASTGKSQLLLFDLTVPQLTKGERSFEKAIAVAEPTALLVYDNQRIVTRTVQGALAYIPGNAQWGDTLPNLIRARVTQSLERISSPDRVARASDLSAAGRQLQIDIRHFEVIAADHPTARVEMSVKISDENQIVAAQTFSAEAPAASDEAGAAAKALDQAFQKVAFGIATWVRDTLGSQR
ncbi:MAG TPA: ABC-type transport auxiliary lipoprotein family protein [Rhizomicrobium sp.]|jgi:phospholipid/cholesterol/gamma-HCH transport system substrate-binding protein|nr:ABC-type transport auxiliary lipoprotein family protein [Rhizomicrobium sp.]